MFTREAWLHWFFKHDYVKGTSIPTSLQILKSHLQNLCYSSHLDINTIYDLPNLTKYSYFTFFFYIHVNASRFECSLYEALRWPPLQEIEVHIEKMFLKSLNPITKLVRHILWMIDHRCFHVFMTSKIATIDIVGHN